MPLQSSIQTWLAGLQGHYGTLGLYGSCLRGMLVIIGTSQITWLINAPFGKFVTRKNALYVNGNIAWALMELVAPLAFLIGLTSQLSRALSPVSIVSVPERLGMLWRDLPLARTLLASLFLLHYANRSVLSTATTSRAPMFVLVPLSAALFNSMNGFLMGTYVGGGLVDFEGSANGIATRQVLAIAQENYGLKDGHGAIFATGVALWLVGFAGNVYSDAVLARTRREAVKSQRAPLVTTDDPKEKLPGSDATGIPDEAVIPVVLGGETDVPVEPTGEVALSDAAGQNVGVPSVAALPVIPPSPPPPPQTTIGNRTYAVPQGFLYSYPFGGVSQPSFLCEWLEWAGYALSASALSPAPFPALAANFVCGIDKSPCFTKALPQNHKRHWVPPEPIHGALAHGGSSHASQPSQRLVLLPYSTHIRIALTAIPQALWPFCAPPEGSLLSASEALWAAFPAPIQTALLRFHSPLPGFLAPLASYPIQMVSLDPPLLFLLAEVSCMLPRAISSHGWYKSTFGTSFPRNRRAVIPGVL